MAHNRRNILLSLGGTVLMGASGIGALAYKGVFIEQKLAFDFPEQLTAPLAPTKECLNAGDEATPAFAEGPFYSPNSPPKTDFLEPDRSGIELHLKGRVFDTECRPMPGVVIDFWHVDQRARYDNVGYRYRGHQYTREDGSYDLLTLHPQPYTLQGIWRTAHLHIKIQGPDTDLVTTQLYFPAYAQENDRDNGYMPELEVDVTDSSPERVTAIFNFVLARRAPEASS